MEYLRPRPGGVYCDATLGAGGHSEQLLLASAPDGRVVGIDRDPSALELARARLQPFGDRFVPIHGRFGELPELLSGRGIGKLDGLVVDLGVSSMQLDRRERGFSFQRSGPIDMRMDPTQGESAHDLIRRLRPEQLAAILSEYGEERYALRIARAIAQAEAAGELTDTVSLSTVIARALPRVDPHKHPATRSFQALRIAVNDELRQLHHLLLAAPSLLAPGGRLAVISFHSLEDRLVKRHFAGEADKSGPRLAALLRRPQLPTDAELAENSRSHSARLRVAELPNDPLSVAEAACRP